MATKRLFVPHAGPTNRTCARAWRQAPGLTRPLAGFDLEVIKVAREQLPFVSKNKLVEIVPD